MVSSVAVLSDVHGVLPVLEAVLPEPDVRTAELIVVTGDHASGPMPVPVLDCLVELGERCLLVRGNADRELVAIRDGEWSEHAQPRRKRTAQQLERPLQSSPRWLVSLLRWRTATR